MRCGADRGSSAHIGLRSKAGAALGALATGAIEFECDGIPYRVRDATRARVLNWIALEAGIHFRRARPWGAPTHIQVEPTANCNLRCALCPVTEGMRRETGSMDMDLYRRLLDEAGRTLLIMLLWDWGEPFVHPRIYDMIALAKRRGVLVVSSSNGQVFAREDHARRLVESGLESLIVAVDGATQETYERYRGNGSLETALTGVRNVLAAKKARGSRTPLVNLRFVVMRHNEHEVPRMRRLAADLDVDVLSLKTLNPYSCDTSAENRETRHEDFEAFIPRQEEYRRFATVSDEKGSRRIRRTPPCKNLWNMPCVHWNGVLCACTYDYDEVMAYGTVARRSFLKAWRGDRLARERRTFLNDWEALPLCRHCSYAYVGGSCWTETIARVFFHSRNARRFARAEREGRAEPLTPA